MRNFFTAYFKGKNLFLLVFLLVLFFLGLYWTLTQQDGDGNGWIMVFCAFIFFFHMARSYLGWRKGGGV